MKTRIEIRKLCKSFGEKQVLAGLDLNIYEGEILCVIGKSGTGKSVIMKHIAGLLSPDSGDILIDGRAYSEQSPVDLGELLAQIGILFQGAALFDSMNVYDNVAFGLRRRGESEDKVSSTVKELLESVGLPDIADRMPSALSGGMQKRVGLARALAVKPSIMLYDEPTTGVDPITAGSVDRLILETRERHGVTSIVVTHDIESAKKIADRIAMVYEGQVIHAGPPASLEDSDNEIIKQFVAGRADGPISVS